jgi:hypothetical protein
MEGLRAKRTGVGYHQIDAIFLGTLTLLILMFLAKKGQGGFFLICFCMIFTLIKLIPVWYKGSQEFVKARFDGALSDVIAVLAEEGFELKKVVGEAYIFDIGTMIAPNLRCIVLLEHNGFSLIGQINLVKRLSISTSKRILADRT